VVGRNEEENQKIGTFSREGDILLRTARYPGPASLLRGDIHKMEIERAASITARYSKAKGMGQVEVTYRKMKETEHCSLFVSPVVENDLQYWIIE
jgi:predicted ribosome quality control (RQC) complex YloA/Tae2 family protein